MAKRTDVIPKDLLMHLQKSIPGFKLEAIKHQTTLARMVWHGGIKRRQHHYFEGAMSFHYKELADSFGRNVNGGGFTAINARLGFFEITPSWESGTRRTAAGTYTKGFRFTPKVQQCRQSYLDRYWRRETKLLLVNGDAMKTLPKAVASKDMRGITTTAWRNAKELNLVRVDLDTLRSLQKWLRAVRDNWREGRAPTDLFTAYPNLTTIERLADMTSQIIRMAKSDVGGHSYCPHWYVEAASGRLYAKGINLQTAPTLIKQAALAGLWEYDFSNCHFDILKQMAEEHGYKCNAITNYLATKKATRLAIAEQAGITETNAKTCLLAIMYGARASEWHENAIPEEIGRDAANRLFAVPLFVGIHADIAKARAAILNGWKRTANGSLTNAFGKAIGGKTKTVEQLAHLIQGVEAKALQAAIDLYPNDIVLLQHDGFAASTRLSAKAIMDAVFKATDYRLLLEEKIIQVDPDAQFLKNRIQIEKRPFPQ